MSRPCTLKGCVDDGATRRAGGRRRQYSLERRDLAQVPWAFEGQGGAAMPAYEYYCDKCRGDVTVTLPISEHDKAKVACPQCGATNVARQLSTFAMIGTAGQTGAFGGGGCCGGSCGCGH